MSRNVSNPSGHLDSWAYGAVINPDLAGAGEGEGITAPDILRVQVRDIYHNISHEAYKRPVVYSRMF